MAVSQDFEARRRERLKMQHKKRERERRIQRIVLIIAIAVLAFLLIFNIVQCSTKDSDKNSTALTTQIPYTEEDTDAKFDPSIPEPKEGRNDYLDIITASGQTNHVYLTFEHGPSEEVTPAILDVLRRYNVKATFFMDGTAIKDNPHLCTRAIEEGHLVLPLSKSGNADILYADKTTFMDEVEETYNLIVKNTPDGKKPVKIYRFLGGSYENSSFGEEKQRYKDELAENGYYYCDWNTTIGDSNTSRTAEQLMTYFNNNRLDVNNLVIQLNNKDSNTATPQMLGNLIEKLLGQGYIFSRLDEIEFVNEIEYEDEEKQLTGDETDEEDDEDDSDRNKATSKPTKSPSSTKKPSTTKAPSATKKPTATTAPATPKPTPKPTTRPATVTQAPQTVTLPPSSGNEIETE